MKGRKSMKDMLKDLFPRVPVGETEVKLAAERGLNRLRLEAAEEIAEFRYRPDIRLRAEALGPLEQTVLTAVWLLRGDGDLVPILRKAEELTSQECRLGAIYVALMELEDLDLVRTRRENTDRPRLYATATEAGIRVLANLAPAQRAIEKLGRFA